MNKLTGNLKDAVDGFTGATYDVDDTIAIVALAHVKRITTDTETGAEDFTYTISAIEAVPAGHPRFDELVDTLTRHRDNRGGQPSLLHTDEPKADNA